MNEEPKCPECGSVDLAVVYMTIQCEACGWFIDGWNEIAETFGIEDDELDYDEVFE